MNANQFRWPVWRVAELKRRAENKESASQIATAFGAGFTRHSVIGKARRSGIQIDSDGLANLRKLAAAKATTPKVRTPRVKCEPAENIEKPVIVPSPPEPVVITPRTAPLVSIMELKNGVCRFPIGDPRDDDFGYCGAKMPEDLRGPYCCEHRLITYTGKSSSDPKPAFWLKPIGASCMLNEAAE